MQDSGITNWRERPRNGGAVITIAIVCCALALAIVLAVAVSAGS